MATDEQRIIELIQRIYKVSGEPVTVTTITARLGVHRDTVTRHIRKNRDQIEKLPYKLGHSTLYRPRQFGEQ